MNLWKKYVGYFQWDQSSAGQPAYHPGPVETSSLLGGASVKCRSQNIVLGFDSLLLYMILNVNIQGSF